MTYGDSFCYHEGINGCHTVEDYQAKIQGVGDSTCAILHRHESLFPDSRIVIIESDVGKSIEYARTAFNIDMSDKLKSTQKRLSGMDGLKIRYTDINSRLKEIWGYLTNTEYDEGRADMLIGLNIQPQYPLNYDMAALQSISHEFL